MSPSLEEDHESGMLGHGRRTCNSWSLPVSINCVYTPGLTCTQALTDGSVCMWDTYRHKEIHIDFKGYSKLCLLFSATICSQNYPSFFCISDLQHSSAILSDTWNWLHISLSQILIKIFP